MEPDNLPCWRNARPEKTLAWANGTSRRAIGVGEKVSALEGQSAPIPRERRASLEGAYILFDARSKRQAGPALEDERRKQEEQFDRHCS